MSIDTTAEIPMTGWATWTRKVTSYSQTQICVIIEKAVLQEADVGKGDLVRGAIKGPSRVWVPFTKRVSVTGTSKCLYLDQVLQEATGADRGDVVDVRIRRL